MPPGPVTLNPAPPRTLCSLLATLKPPGTLSDTLAPGRPQRPHMAMDYRSQHAPHPHSTGQRGPTADKPLTPRTPDPIGNKRLTPRSPGEPPLLSRSAGAALVSDGGG